MKKIKALVVFAVAAVIAITCTGCTSIYLEAPQYKGIEVKYSDIAVKDEKVTERIDTVREEHATGGYITDRGVLNGDTVVGGNSCLRSGALCCCAIRGGVGRLRI